MHCGVDRLLTSWDSVSAIYDLLSSILPPIYASQLRDLRDGKKRTRAGGGPARRAKEARALPVGRRRAYTEWDDRGSEPDSLARAASPPPIDVIPTAVAAVELKVEQATKPELTSVEEKNKEKNEEERKEAGSEEEEREGGDGGDTEHVGGREVKGGSTTKSKTSGKKEKRKGSKAKKSGGGSSQHKKEATTAKEEASPLKAGHTLEGIQGSSTGKNLTNTTTGDRISSGDSGSDGSGGGSGRGSRTTSPRLVVDDDRRQKGSRIQMSKEDFIRELQRQKEAKLQPGGASPLASPRSPKGTVPASLSASPPADRRLSVGDGDDARSRTSAIELPEPVRRFFTPPGSPRPEAASPPLSPTATPTSPMSPRSETGSPLSPAARRLTTVHHAATAPAGLRYPTIPPSFDVAKAMADLAALDQEYADFEEIHTLEEKLLSARSETAGGAGGGNNALADLFELANGHQAQRGKEKAGSGDDEDEGIYSLLSPRKYAKRPSVINQKEFDELRLQVSHTTLTQPSGHQTHTATLLSACGTGEEAQQDLGHETYVVAAQHAGAQGFLHQRPTPTPSRNPEEGLRDPPFLSWCSARTRHLCTKLFIIYYKVITKLLQNAFRTATLRDSGGFLRVPDQENRKPFRKTKIRRRARWPRNHHRMAAAETPTERGRGRRRTRRSSWPRWRQRRR